LADRKDEFLPKYHRAMVLAMKEDLEKVKPRIASVWIKEWMEGLEPPPGDTEEFRARFEGFLRELGFSESSTVSVEAGELSIRVEGCSICPGNELLRQGGEPTLCPILATGLQAISRVLGSNATLLGVEKEDRVGYCTIRYELATKTGGGGG